MTVELAQWIVRLGLAYAGLGILFAVPFAFRFAARMDPNAREGSLGFRLAILPASAALWPLLLSRVLRGVDAPPTERSPHRAAARPAGGDS